MKSPKFAGFTLFVLITVDFLSYTQASPLDLAVKLERLLLDPDYDLQSNAIDIDGDTSSEMAYMPVKRVAKSSDEVFLTSDELQRRKFFNGKRTRTTTESAIKSNKLAKAEGGFRRFIRSMVRTFTHMIGISPSKE